MAKTGRNEPCPCGSGRKYKHCCLSRDEAAEAAEREALEDAALSSLEDDDGLFGEDDDVIFGDDACDVEDEPDELQELPDVVLPPIPAGSARLARAMPTAVDAEEQKEALAAAASRLESHVKEFRSLCKDADAFAKRARAVFEDPRFDAMRFTAEDLTPYFELVGYPLLDREQSNKGYVDDLIDVIFDEDDGPKLTMLLLDTVLELTAAERPIDACIVLQSAVLAGTSDGRTCSPFLHCMVYHGLREWMAARHAEHDEFHDRFGIDPDAGWGNGGGDDLNAEALSADGGTALAIRDYLASHPQLEHWLQAGVADVEAAAMAMLEREAPESVLLHEDEVAPWVAVLTERLLTAAQSRGRKRQTRAAEEEEFARALYDTAALMAREIFTAERLEVLRNDLDALGRELAAAGRPDEKGIMGARLAASILPARRDSEFLRLLCILSLFHHERRTRGGAGGKGPRRRRQA